VNFAARPGALFDAHEAGMGPHHVIDEIVHARGRSPAARVKDINPASV